MLLIQSIVFAQEYSLLVTNRDSSKLKEIENISYSKKHVSEKSIIAEILNIKHKLNRKGFLKVQHILKKQDTSYVCYINLGRKTNVAVISCKNTKSKIPFKEIENYISKKKSDLDQQGKLFTEIKLSNISIVRDTLFAELSSKQKRIRYFDKVVIKGYQKFPESYLKNFLGITPKTKVSKKKLNRISKQINSLEFVSEIKKNQLLFTKDSTFLFLFLKKEYRNFFDGFINVSSKNDKIKINGQLSLGLRNIFNRGENFSMSWNSNFQNTSFNTELRIPYLFSTPLIPEISFTIFKQDSTFLNSELETKLSYQLSPKSVLSLNYLTNSSSDLLNNKKNSIHSFSNNFIGISFETIIKSSPSLLDKNSNIKASLLFGSRNSTSKRMNQIKLMANWQHNQKLSQRSSLCIKSQIGYLISESYLENELFRIGGPNSISGFLSRSIPASQYITLKTQYNYFINEKTQVYPLLDLSKYYFNGSSNLLSTGIGYSQLKNNTLITLEYAIGKRSKENFNFNNSFLTVKMIAYY